MASSQYMGEISPTYLRGRLVGIVGACFQVGLPPFYDCCHDWFVEYFRELVLVDSAAHGDYLSHYHLPHNFLLVSGNPSLLYHVLCVGSVRRLRK